MSSTTPVIAIGNQKGGVGKSTNCVHLAAALGSMGRRCLIIDLDPAAGATKHLGVPQNSFAGTLEVLTTDESPLNFVITAAMPEGVHLIPSRTELAEIDTLLSKYADKTRLLEPVISQLAGAYDYIFLDTGPSAAFTTTVAAYCAAQWVLLSAFPHPLSMAGLTEAFRDISDVRRSRNPGLEVLGIVFTNVDRRASRLRARLEAVVTEALPGRQFRTSISQSVELPTVSGDGITLFQHATLRNHTVANEYRALAHEVEHRITHRAELISGTLVSMPADPLQCLAAPELVGN